MTYITIRYGVEIVMGIAYINPIKHDTPKIQIKGYDFVGEYGECKAYAERSNVKHIIG